MARKQEYKTRNRYFCGILYEEDPNFEKYMNYIKEHYLEVTYIRHDRDTKENEDGEEEYKKAHIHILFKVGENARSLKAVAEEIEIPPNYIQGCNKKAMLMYFIHLNNPEKTQYTIDEVKGELRGELAEILYQKEPEENKLTQIMNMVLTGQINSITELMTFAIESGNQNLIRKYQYLLVQTITENKSLKTFSNHKKRVDLVNTN